MYYKHTLQIGTNITKWVLVSQKILPWKPRKRNIKKPAIPENVFHTEENVYVLSTVLLFYSQVYTLCATMWLSSFLSVNFLVFLLI